MRLPGPRPACGYLAQADLYPSAADAPAAARVQVEFVNGRVEEFLPGRSLSAAAMRTPEVSAAIAAATAAFHVRMLARLPSATRGGAAASNDGCDGLESVVAELQGGQPQQHQQDGQQQKDQQQDGQQHRRDQHPQACGEAAPGLQAAIYHRILTWHAAALQLCGDRVEELGLGHLPQEVRHTLYRPSADGPRCRYLPLPLVIGACLVYASQKLG